MLLIALLLLLSHLVGVPCCTCYCALLFSHRTLLLAFCCFHSHALLFSLFCCSCLVACLALLSLPYSFCCLAIVPCYSLLLLAFFRYLMASPPLLFCCLTALPCHLVLLPDSLVRVEELASTPTNFIQQQRFFFKKLLEFFFF